jgi:hypothetical protein
MLRGGHSAADGSRGNRLRGALVVAEIALSLVVLVGAGLLLKSFHRLLNVEPGFKAEQLLTASLSLVEMKEGAQRTSLVNDALARIANLPGVIAVSGGSALPPVNAQRATRFSVEGLPAKDGAPRSAYFIAVSPDYFRALGTPLRAGREFTARDAANAAKTVIVNQTLARTLFPTESPLGKRLQIINSEESNEWREIVGVVADVRYSGLDDPGETDLTPEEWRTLASRGELRYRIPGARAGNDSVGEERARRLGIPEADRAEVNRVFVRAQERLMNTLRGLYREAASADPAGLSMEALCNEIRDKAPEDVLGRVNYQLSQERGGVLQWQPPRADMPPYERMMRTLIAYEREIESELAPVVGDRIAHGILHGENQVSAHSYGLTGRPSDAGR